MNEPDAPCPRTVRDERDGHIATISRPEKLDAITAAVRRDLDATSEWFRADDDARVAIATGTRRACCAGADLHDGAGAADSWPGSFWEIPTVDPRFGMPEIRLGVPTIVGAMRLARRVGMQAALELLLTGELIDAARAKETAHPAQTLPWSDAVRMGEAMRRVVLATEDAAEGMDVAREGRPPRWSVR